MTYECTDLFSALEFAALEHDLPFWQVLAEWEENLSDLFRASCRRMNFVGNFTVKLDVNPPVIGFYMVKRVFADARDTNIEMSLADAKTLNQSSEINDQLWIEIDNHFEDKELQQIVIKGFGETIESIKPRTEGPPKIEFANYINSQFIDLKTREEIRKQFVFLGTNRVHSADVRRLYALGCVFLSATLGAGRWYTPRHKEAQASSCYEKVRKIYPKPPGITIQFEDPRCDNLANYDEENPEWSHF